MYITKYCIILSPHLQVIDYGNPTYVSQCMVENHCSLLPKYILIYSAIKKARGGSYLSDLLTFTTWEMDARSGPALCWRIPFEGILPSKKNGVPTWSIKHFIRTKSVLGSCPSLCQSYALDVWKSSLPLSHVLLLQSCAHWVLTLKNQQNRNGKCTVKPCICPFLFQSKYMQPH